MKEDKMVSASLAQIRGVVKERNMLFKTLQKCLSVLNELSLSSLSECDRFAINGIKSDIDQAVNSGEVSDEIISISVSSASMMNLINEYSPEEWVKDEDKESPEYGTLFNKNSNKRAEAFGFLAWLRDR